MKPASRRVRAEGLSERRVGTVTLMPNRLAAATSPYLQQHAENPVDWWPWGEEAFEEARRRDLPLLISVGYAACHWCHVMAHESFEDEAVAEVVNELVVPIKVDREERPDVDAVYMTATQAMTGQGGWPMTVFATPDGQPFYCGTYFPRDTFLRLVRSVSDAWREQREAIVRQSAAVVEAIGRVAARRPSGPMSEEVLDEAAASLAKEYDREHAGFGGAPKFPPHMNLLFLLRHHERTHDEQSLAIVRHTAERMARGGMYDQLAGGFARYSVDRTWTVPHFEKMLYDNALLLRVYTQLWRLTGDPLAGRVAHETAGFLLRDLRTAEGGFASALDADTDGVEGLTYVWTPEQLREVLGDDDGAWAAGVLTISDAGTFEQGTSVAQLPADPDDPQRWALVRQALAGARAKGPQPRQRPAAPQRPSRSGGCWRRSTWSSGGCAGSPATAPLGRRPGSWRTTAAWPRRSARCTSSPPTATGSPLPGCSWTPRWSGSPTARAASTTPRTMPSSWSRARPTRPTTRPRPGSRRWRRR